MKRGFTMKLVLWSVLVAAGIFASLAYSHCQIPCGIYNDQMRFDMIAEHIATVEKAMNQITQLSGEARPNMNQIVRWVENKDKHADEMSEVITYYFMTQRVKPAAESDTKAYNEYVKQLTLLHEMLVYAMKAKQTTDIDNVEKLKSLLAKFHDVYFGKTGANGQDHSSDKHG